MEQRSAAAPGCDGTVALGQLAALLADRSVDGCRALPDALALLVEALGLRSALLRGPGPDGDLIALAGDTVHAVHAARARRSAPDRSGPALEVPVFHGGRERAVLLVHGARPSHLAALRSAAAILGLALSTRHRAAEPLATQLVGDSESDRDALADALHDGPVQSLVVARYAADAAVRQGDPHGSVALVRDAVQDALVGVRRAMWQLRPRAADDLAGALAELSARLVESGAPALELDLDADLTGFPPAVATTAYRVVQAAATAATAAVRVRSLTTADGPALEVHGTVDVARWGRRAEAVDAVLQASSGCVRLLVPTPRPLALRSPDRIADEAPSRTTRPKATT